MTVLNRGAFAFAFAAGSIALANCSGGGGSSGGSGPPTSSPTVTPTATSSGAATSASFTAPLPPAGVIFSLPAIGGAGGTITYPTYKAANAVTEVTYTTTLKVGAGAPAPQKVTRQGAIAPSIVETEQLSANGAVTFSAIPAFALTLPTGTSNAGPFGLEVFDQTANTVLASEAAISVSGNVVNFCADVAAFQFVVGHTYALELVLGGTYGKAICVAASPSPVPSHTPQPTPTPTVGPTASPTPTTSPSPTPSPTSTPACNANSDPNVGNVTMTGSQQTIDIPCFKSFRANDTLPANNGGGTVPINLHVESSTDKPLGAPSPAPGTGTAIFYESFKPNYTLQLNGTVITANISSQSKILPGSTYAANVFLQGTTLVPTITGIVPSGNNISFTITLPPNSVFPQGTPTQIVLYKSS